ncbi:MAG: site-specific integrase [Pseudomonadota bacterium]
MSDIRKRTGTTGTTYQVRYPSKTTKSGYAYATFNTLKEARAFVESGRAQDQSSGLDLTIRRIPDAVDKWLKICEKEGTDRNEPVTSYTLKSYEYFADFMKAYDWPKELQQLTSPDVVEFRSWLLEHCPSRYTARKALSYFHSVLNEMSLRGHIASNPANSISIRADSRYDEPIVIPTRQDVVALLRAADDMANSKNALVAKTWERYRPVLYLAADSGMRPQEYLALAKTAIRENGVQIDRAIEGGSKKISVTKTPAGRRFIELSTDTLSMVRYYADELAAKNDYDLVFPTANGKWQCPRNWRKRGFNAVCMKAGLIETVKVGGEVIERPKYRPYDLRHFYASMLFEKKTNLKKIQTLMGHTNITTTLNVYGHLIEGVYDDEKVDTGILGQMGLISCGKSVARPLQAAE